LLLLAILRLEPKYRTWHDMSNFADPFNAL